MKVAVTGASGFIGRCVIAELTRYSAEVVAITRDANRLADVNSCCEIVEMDITKPSQDSFAQIGHPDLLIHLAWDGLSDYQSMRHTETELPAQLSFLNSLINSGLSTLFVAGTCQEYGMQYGPLSIDLPPQPVTQYAIAKNLLREGLEDLQKRVKFNLTWGRLFYMYGEHQSRKSLYSLLKEAVSKGEPEFHMSGGEQLRDYLKVEMVAAKIVDSALGSSVTGVVNICSSTPISVRRLVEEWIYENGWEIKLILGSYPYPEYEPMAFWGS